MEYPANAFESRVQGGKVLLGSSPTKDRMEI